MSFDTGLNSLTIVKSKQTPEDFLFTGCKIDGVEPGSTPTKPIYSTAALDELMAFTTLVAAERITINDNNANTKPVSLDYQYTVSCQQLSDAKPFHDDPRIINQTGG